MRASCVIRLHGSGPKRGLAEGRPERGTVEGWLRWVVVRATWWLVSGFEPKKRALDVAVLVVYAV